MKVPRNFLEQVCELTEIRSLQATSREALRTGWITGLSAAVGVLLLGPLGAPIGGSIGGALSYATMDNVQSAPYIIMQLSPEKRTALVNDIRDALTNVGIKTLLNFAAQAVQNPVIGLVTAEAVTNFIRRQRGVLLK